MSQIKLTIDQLVLKGMETSAARALVSALRSELSRLLADPANRSEWARTHRTPVVRLGSLTIAPGPTGGRKFGGGMAQAIGKGLRP
jgi:hypothetical protein